jgi:hypothetical protein
MMRLSLRTKKLSLMLATCILLGATIAVLAWGVRRQDCPAGASTQSARTTRPIDVPEADKNKEPSREELTQLLDRPLRQALYDPPPPAPEVKQLPPLQVELLGTILEPENSMAIIRAEGGSVQYKRVGETMGPAECPASLIDIQSDAIVVERHEERLTLKVRGGELR